jgi:serpin B
MGMTLPFRENQADFGGMVGEADGVPGVSVSQIRHQACLEVDEEGTRVAAATAADCEAAKEPIPFRADRPFLFLLIERQTNAILFMGRVTNPLE